MTEMTHETHEEHIHLPENSFWPLVLGGGMFVLLFGMALRDYRMFVAPAGLLILGVGLGGWITSIVGEKVPSITPVIAGKMAMCVFLASEVLFFTGLIASFLLLRAEAAPGVDHALVASIPLVSINTFILLTSSLTVVMSHDAAARNLQGRLKVLLFLTILLGTTFLSLQCYEYNNLYHEGLSWTGNGYGTAFFTLTGTHGLHVIIGIIWCAVVLIRALQGGFNAKNYSGVEIFGLYWHFVDIVWILLFTLVYLMNTSAGLPVK